MSSDYSASDLKKDVKDAARDAERAVDDATSRSNVERAREKGHDMVDAAASQVDQLRERGAEYVHAARERGADLADSAKHEAERLYRAGQDRAHQAADAAGEYYDEVSDMVRRQPAAALGIAAGVGFLLGLIIARR